MLPIPRELTQVPCPGRIGIKALDSKKSGQASAVRAGYLFAQSARLSEQLSTINAVLASLVRSPLSPCLSSRSANPLHSQTELLATMSQLAERAEALVIEAAKTRGTMFAFRDPLWVTWPLSRFGESQSPSALVYGSARADPHSRSLSFHLRTMQRTVYKT